MKIFEKRHFVLLIAIFLLFMMVSSVNAIEVDDDAVVNEDLAIDTITSTDADTVDIDDLSSTEILGDDSVADPSDSEVKSSEEIYVDDISDEDSSDAYDEVSKETVDSSSHVLKASSEEDDILGAHYVIYVGPDEYYKNLQAAIYALRGATDTFDIVIREGTYTGTGNINVDVSRSDGWRSGNPFADLTIRAEEGAKVIFDGQNRYTLFEINSPNVHIQGITFINANPTTNDSGVCVDIHQSHVSIDDCNFTDNGNEIIWGGAIHVDSRLHDINITNSYFENNIADVGGAIRSELNSYDINIINTTFIGNEATAHGGVACLFGEYSLFENCYFENNTAPSSGAVHFHSGNSVINNCTFVGNTATGGGTERQSGYAGAVGLVYEDNTGVTINNTNFYNNTAVRDGGAVQIIGGGSNAHIYNSEFENNSALYGGAISVVGQNTVIENVTLNNNNATNGSAIYVEGRGTTINNATATNNTASLEGGAAYVKGANCHVYNSTFADNTAGDDGGAIYWEGNNGIVDNVAFTNNTGISDGSSNSKGGSICLTGSNVRISNSNFTSSSVINSDETDGGAIFVTGNNANITGCEFTDNNASRYGGAIQIVGNNTRITDCSFEENNALPNEDKKDDGLGGAIYMAGNNGHVTDCDFTHNTARNGSAIYVNPASTSGTNYIDNCDFVENQAWVYWLPILYDEENQKIETNLTGGNNIMNAIYNKGTRNQLKINGTSPVDGWENSQGGTLVYQDDLEKDQEIIITVFDRDGQLLFNETRITNLSGTVSVDIPEDTSSWFIINMTHTEDPYYKHITNLTAININPGITIDNVTMYEGNESAQLITIDLIDVSGKPIDNATINVTVVYNGQEIQIGSGVTSPTGVLQISEETYFKTFKPGNYTTKAQYTYAYFNTTTGKYENKTLTGEGNLEVLPIVVLNITKQANVTEVVVGDNVCFSVYVKNNGPSDAHNVIITDVLDEAFEFSSCSSLGSYDEATRTVTWNIPQIIAGDSYSVSVTVTVSKMGTFNNTAVVVSDENKTETNDTTNITVKNVDLDITKVANATEVYVGDEVTFTITVTNNGDGIAHNANVTDVLDEAFEYVSGGSYDAATRTVTWNLDQIGAGETAEVTVVVTVSKGGKFNNTATVVCDENKTETNDTTDITVKKLNIIIVVGNYTTTPDTDVLVEITVVDENGEKVSVNLTVEVTGPEDTDSLPPHNSLGAGEIDVEVKDGEGSFTYHVPADAKDGTSYVVTAASEANDKYNDAEGTGYIDVEQYETNTTISNASGAPGDEVSLTVEVTTEDGTPFNGDVVVTCPDGSNVTVSVTDGKGDFKWTIPEDAENGTEYEFTASFGGNSTYLASSGSGVVTAVTEDEPVPDEEPDEEPVPDEEPEVPEEPETPEEPSADEPVDDTPAVKMLSTGNPLIALLAAFVLIGLGIKRREDE
ncbi:CARDB domain-containing protein [Methanobrevibacter sp.]